MVAIASLGRFMANSRLASVLGVFSNFTLTRVTKEGYTKSGLPTPFINKDNFQKAIAKI